MARRAKRSEQTGLSPKLLKQDASELNLLLSNVKEKNGISQEIPTVCGHFCYLISYSSVSYVLYVPINVTKLNTNHTTLEFMSHIKDLTGEITVTGKYVTVGDISSMFDDYINWDETPNVKSTECMFSRCEADIIGLSELDTHSVTSAGEI